MSEEKAILEKAKAQLRTLNWFTIIAILSGVGLVLFIIWYLLRKQSKEKEKQ